MKKILACMFVMALGLLSRPASAATIDATTGASFWVTGGTTTTSTVNLKWKETETKGGVLRFYWDTTNNTRVKMRDSVAVPLSARGGAGWSPAGPFKAGKVYNYAFQGFYPTATAANLKTNYATSGKFTMDGATGILHFMDMQGRPVSNPFDAMGRPSAATKAGNMRLTNQGAAPSLLP